MAEKKKEEVKEAVASVVDASANKPEGSADETIPGGRYKVGEKWVNAHGEEIK